MRKGLVIIVFVLMLLLNATGQVIAHDEIAEYGEERGVYIIIASFADVENNPLYFLELMSDVPAYIVDGTTMVPLRALAEGFSYNVDYQEIDKTILIQDAAGKNELIFTIGSTTVLQNGQQDTMLQAPVIRNGRTFMPLRYVSEFFGKYVTWKTGFSGNKMIIWVSSVQLLAEDDVAAEKDDVNYYDYATEQNDPIPYYHLKSDGQTYRGIRIGDRFEKVLELYGEPHGKIQKDGILHSITYRTEAIPFDDPGSVMIFYFTNGLVHSVSIDGRW